MTDVQVPPPPPAPLSTKEARAQGKASKAYAKAQRPFYKKKRYILPTALIVVIIAIAAASGGGDSKKGATAGGATTVPSASGAATSDKLYPNRPDSQGDDHEAAIGQGAELRGRTATVTSAVFQPSLSSFENDGYMVANVTILNRNEDAQSYNQFDWRLQTPEGQVLDPTFASVDPALHSGDLVKGGTVTGNVVFKVGSAPHGVFYLIYKPDLASDRGIWGVTIP